MKEQQNNAYENMFRTAKEWLLEREPEEIARCCGISWMPEESAFSIETLGKCIKLTWPDLAAEPALENWHMLVMLHYLYRGDGTAPTGEMRSPADMRDGLIRGGKFAFTAERTFTRMLKGKSEREILAAFSALGGKRIEGRADIDLMVPFMPHFPVYLSIYLGDEDFPASGKFFVDAMADHYLTIEDAVTVGDLILTMAEKNLI